MNYNERNELLDNVARIWSKYPSMRFGQLLMNLYATFENERRRAKGVSVSTVDPFPVDDKEFVIWLRRFDAFKVYDS